MDAVSSTDFIAQAPSPALPARPDTLLRFLTCGSVDDGKSTLIGRLLHDAGQVPTDQMATLARDSRRFGTDGENLDFALLVDGLSAEREQGITIDVAYRYFSTRHGAFIVADTPGHEQYTRNMATGASNAELAVILVDARKGILPQTRRHSFIVGMLRVRHVVLAVNKMDLVGFDQAVFDTLVAAYREAVAPLGFADTTAIPICAREGDNVVGRSPRMDWYQGPTLLGHLEQVRITANAPDVPARLPVQWVNRPNASFRGYAGNIARGTLRQGETIRALPSGRTSRVSRIVTADGDLDEAVAGQAVTITLTDELDVSRGDVLVGEADTADSCRHVSARLLWMDDTDLAIGGEYELRLGTATATARVAALTHAIEIHSYAPHPAEGLASNGIGEVVLDLDRPVVVAPYDEDSELGGFILIDRLTNRTAAMGMVIAARAPSQAATPEKAARRLALRSASLQRAGGSVITAALAWAFTGELRLGLAIGATEFVIKAAIAVARARRRAAQPGD